MVAPSPSDSRPRHAPRTRWVELACVAAACAVIVWLYGWCASPGEKLFGRFGGKHEYYGLLLRGFEKGHLWMDAETDPVFAASPDPYTPGKRNGTFLPDASFYHGRFYLYFGVAPVVTLYWPVHAITGWYLRGAQAVSIFLSVGFLAGVALLLGLRRRHLPDLGSVPVVLGVIAWGTTPLLFLLARRPTFYEVPISSAFAFMVLSLLGLFMAERSARPSVWIGLASLAYGLAIASRPTYLFGAVILLLPAISAFLRKPPEERPWLRRFVAAALPLGLVIAGMLVYNFERFGSFLDFGRQYQLLYMDQLHVMQFSTTFMPENLYLYLFSPAQLGGYFPFFFPIEFSHGPSGYAGIEDAYGLLVNAPFLFMVFASVLAFRRTGPRQTVLAAVLLLATIGPIILGFFAATIRYAVDFAPAVALLAVLGFWELWDCCVGWLKGLFAIVSVALLAWSIAFNLFAAIGHVQMLKSAEPAVYESLGQRSGTPRHLLDRLTGRAYGPLELTLQFPAFTTAHTEPLATAGYGDETDYVYVRYEDPHHIRLGYEHMYVSRVLSAPLEIDYSKPHVVRITMGSLYPPANDPYFDGLSPKEKQQRLETVKLELDGEPAASLMANAFTPVSPLPLIGGSTLHQQVFGEHFTGKILEKRVIDVAKVVTPPLPRAGAYVLSLVLPSPAVDQSIPILSTGVAGKADVLSAHFIDATHVQFRLDRWGSGFFTGPVLSYVPGKQQTVIVSFGSFYPEDARPATISPKAWEAARRHAHVLIDGEDALDVASDFYPATDETTYVGHNPMGASTCGADYSGELYGYERTLTGLPFLH